MEQAWFTVGICPASPDLMVEYTRADGRTLQHAVPVLLLQYHYPVDANGARVPGSDWDTSQVTVGVVEMGNYIDPVTENNTNIEVFMRGGSSRSSS